jgi:predicted NBD/HSP70 family sugar kinase
MRRLVREAMEAGALGFSTGLEFDPGRLATMEEIVALAAVAGDTAGLSEVGTSVVPLYGRHPIGLAQLARTAAVGGRLRRVVEVAGGDVSLVRGEHVQAAAEEGDGGALAVIDEFARWVALGLVNLTNAFDPGTFVLGGGLAEGSHLYLDPIQRWFGELLYAPDRRPHPGLSFAALGEHAGAIGAALLPTTRP